MSSYRLQALVAVLTLSQLPLTFAGDPTRPPYLNSRPAPKVVREAPLAPLALSAIFYSQQRKLAIINDSILRVGESIEGATITDISRTHVTVLRRGKSSQLRLPVSSTIIRSQASNGGQGGSP